MKFILTYKSKIQSVLLIRIIFKTSSILSIKKLFQEAIKAEFLDLSWHLFIRNYILLAWYTMAKNINREVLFLHELLNKISLLINRFILFLETSSTLNISLTMIKLTDMLVLIGLAIIVIFSLIFWILLAFTFFARIS